MSLMDLFNFVTDPSFGDDNETVDRELEKASTSIILYAGQLILILLQIQQKLNAEPEKERNTTEEEIFKRSYIPQTLEEVIDVERDTLRVADGGGKDVSSMIG